MEAEYTTFSLAAIPGTQLSDALRLTVSSPPLNILGVSLLNDLYKFLTSLSSSPAPPKVVVVSSSNPDFWIGHLDLHIASQQYPHPNPHEAGEALHHLGAVTHLLGKLQTIFIAEVDGRAVAGGNEMALNMDMRFAGPNARFGAVEVGGGLIHVGALQQLTRLIGAGRAAEYMLGSTSVDALSAERVGWVNRAFNTMGELRAHVDNIVQRIALFPRDGLRYTKMGIRENVAGTGSVEKDLGRFKELLGKEDTQKAISRIVELSGGFSLGEFELGLPDTIVGIWVPERI